MQLASLALPWRKQETLFTCGPACVRMLLAGIEKDVAEETLAQRLRTTARTGTRRSAFAPVLRAEGFRCAMNAHARIADLRDAIASGHYCLINWREPTEETGHYAIVTAVNGTHATLQDPWNGADFRLPIHELRDRWLGYKTRADNRGWMLAIGRARGDRTAVSAAETAQQP